MSDPLPMGMIPGTKPPTRPPHSLTTPPPGATALLACSGSRRGLDEQADFFPSYRP